MRRKYDLRNKRNFIIITILMIAIICIFSLFIHKYNKASKIQYNIETGSVIQDVNKNYLNTSEDAALRIRWNDNYYLIYQDKKINLGKKVIVYNTITGAVKLYGKFYEINSDGKIISHNGETILSNNRDAKFYKLDDREYLLVDKSIVSVDRSINASNYLLVELDKLGNAKLSNDTLNLKTVSSTTLVTSGYKFDIANEKLGFNNLEIDLKKIIGSTNEFEEEEIPPEDNGNGSGEGNGQGNTAKKEENKKDKLDPAKIEEIKNKAKSTSIVRIIPGLRQIDVDYVVYDPYNEITSVEARIKKTGGIDVVPMPKNDTHVVLGNLSANTTYRNVEFVYTTIDAETGKTIEHYIDDPMDITTKMPVFDISIYKYASTDKNLTYKVTIPNDYKVSEINVELEFHDKVYDDNGDPNSIKRTKTSSIKGINTSDSIVYGTIDLSEYNIDRDNSLILTITSVKGLDGRLDINKSYSFKFAR